MRIVKATLAVVFASALGSVAHAQGAKPADPNSWADGVVINAQSGSAGATISGFATTNDRGFSGARHDAGESDSHPTPPSGVDVPVGPD